MQQVHFQPELGRNSRGEKTDIRRRRIERMRRKIEKLRNLRTRAGREKENRTTPKTRRATILL